MKNIPLIGLAGVATTCSLAVSLPAISANLNDNDSCFNNSGCTSVHSELAIIIDGSDSVPDDEFTAILGYYGDVFSSPFFYEEILEPLGASQSIAVSVFQFGYVPALYSPILDREWVRQEIEWTLIDSQASSEAFANQFLNIAQMGGSKSPIGSSIAEAHNGSGSNQLEGLRNNNFVGDYLVMDISSDGFNFGDIVQWRDSTRAAYGDGIDAINAIAVDPERVPDFVDPILDNIVSLTDINGNPLIRDDDNNPVPGATWNNPSGTEGFLTVTGTIDNYQQLLANKVAQETLPPDTFDPDRDYLVDDEEGGAETVPEPSLLWGIIGFGCLGLLGKIISPQ